MGSGFCLPRVEDADHRLNASSLFIDHKADYNSEG